MKPAKGKLPQALKTGWNRFAHAVSLLFAEERPARHARPQRENRPQGNPPGPGIAREPGADRSAGWQRAGVERSMAGGPGTGESAGWQSVGVERSMAGEPGTGASNRWQDVGAEPNPEDTAREALSPQKPRKRVWAMVAGAAALFLAVPLVLALTYPGRTHSAETLAFPTQPDEEETLILAPAVVASPHPQGLTATSAPQQTPVSTPAPTVAPLPAVVTLGVTHPQVAEIHARLMELSYMDEDSPSEEYSEAIRQGVSLFQKKNGLAETGDLTESDRELLFSDSAKVYVVSHQDKGTDVEELQIRLRELGYIDQVTAYFGTDTQAAVKKFQSRNGLTTDGSVGPATREMLYSEEAKANAWSYGENDEKIKTYQKKLKELGYLTTTPDGNYGSDTVAAVKRFQTNSGLIADGYLGPRTLELLLSSEAQGNALQLGMSGDDVEKVQTRLKKLGYLKSGATGYFGSDTDAAVKAFQKNNKLTADGKVGRATMNLLMSSSARGTSTGSSQTTGADKLIKVARTKLGCKYVRGGKGPNTFDCSGFVWWCMKEVGFKQGYMTSYAWRSTNKFKRIKDFDAIRKGDIIVYKMSSTKGHVGIASSSSVMIDASSGNMKVVERSFRKDPYWKKRFYCAYRIF